MPGLPVVSGKLKRVVLRDDPPGTGTYSPELQAHASAHEHGSAQLQASAHGHEVSLAELHGQVSCVLLFIGFSFMGADGRRRRSLQFSREFLEVIRQNRSVEAVLICAYAERG